MLCGCQLGVIWVLCGFCLDFVLFFKLFSNVSICVNTPRSHGGAVDLEIWWGGVHGRT